jgi:PAS domain S-box-containing protein
LELFLNPSQSLFQALANISPVGIFQTDAAGLYVYVNRRWCEIAGMTPEKAYGTGWAAALYAGDQRRVCEEWYSAIRENSRFSSKYRFQRPDGTIAWVFAQAVKHAGANGDAGGYIGTTTDITEIEEKAVELRTAKEQYQLLFDSNPLPGWVFDLETLKFLEVNQMAVSHYGYSRAEFLAMTLDEIRPPEEVARLGQSLKNLPVGLKRAGVWIHKKKDGTLIDVEVFNYGIVFHGRPARLVLVNDVTDRKHYEETLKENARMTALAETASIFAHEVANPLNGISTILQMLMREHKAGDGNSGEMVQDALNEINRLGGLLQEFRSFGRPEDITKEPLNLREIIKEVLSVGSAEYSDRGISVEQEYKSDDIFLSADRDKLKQVLLNLFKNSVEAMPKGGTLKIRARTSSNHVIVEVIDTGIGIPTGTRVFDPFMTTKPLGTGLGLAVVKKIVTAHRGTVSYQSEQGRGTVFTLTFPKE